jgi:hypothetical protein
VYLPNTIITHENQIPTGYSNQAGFVFILGMHRSGTSCLAGSLERCGLFLGDVTRRSPFNAKGNHEFRKVWQAHNQILRASGGDWHRPPDRVQATWRQRQTLKAIATRLTKHKPCGLKDPRLLLLLDLWTQIVDSYALVGTFRHPVAVARSLAERNQMPEDQAYDLWQVYNAELIRLHKRCGFPIVKFDLADVEAYYQTVAAVAVTLGLAPDMAQLREFVSPKLDHHRSPDGPVPTICQEAYAYLQYHQCQPPDPD